jgi:SPP1 family predicted phage head-tail adaptor
MLTQRLRHRVDIQRKTEEFTSYGEGIGYVWTDYLTDVPAEVLTGPGREFIAAGTKQSETTARITLRWFDGLLPSMRLLWDGRVFDIQSIETDATARREWRLRCTDGVNDGA